MFFLTLEPYSNLPLKFVWLWMLVFCTHMHLSLFCLLLYTCLCFSPLLPPFWTKSATCDKTSWFIFWPAPLICAWFTWAYARFQLSVTISQFTVPPYTLHISKLATILYLLQNSFSWVRLTINNHIAKKCMVWFKRFGTCLSVLPS